MFAKGEAVPVRVLMQQGGARRRPSPSLASDIVLQPGDGGGVASETSDRNKVSLGLEEQAPYSKTPLLSTGTKQHAT